MDESNLLENLKAGDLRAFEEILSKYERHIFNYLKRLTMNADDAEDLTQETFLKLYDKRASLIPEKGAKSWLFAVATNAAYDLFRKRKRGNEVFLEDGELETKPADSPYQYIEASADIASALASLKPVYRSVLTLFYKDGFTYEEIAEFLGMPLNTVKTHIRRGKEALKKSLPDYENG